MKITISVKPGAREDTVKKRSGAFFVSTRARSQDGEANEAVIRLLADYFDVARSRVRIVSGSRSRTKKIEIL